MPSGAGAGSAPAGASAGASAGWSTPSVEASSPDSYISMMMSEPPISSPLTNSCGIVGQSDSAATPWGGGRPGGGLLADARGGGDVDGCEADLEGLQRGGGAGGEPARRGLGHALHEED